MGVELSFIYFVVEIFSQTLHLVDVLLFGKWYDNATVALRLLAY